MPASSPVPVIIRGWDASIGDALQLAWSAAVVFGLIAVVLGVALTLAVLTRR